MTNAELQQHWERAYNSKSASSVSWYQPVLEKSVKLILGATPNASASVIDLGGGASTLPDSLLKANYTDITVIDISQAALDRSQARLGEDAARVNWLVADITSWSPSRTWDVWHDRAVFHFLTEEQAQDRYIAALRQGTHSGSTVIISTFALDGPERCSGLSVLRYSPVTLAARIGAPFVLVAEDAERHLTPGGGVQSFMYAVLKRL